MNTISANQHITGKAAVICQIYRHATCVLRETLQPRIAEQSAIRQARFRCLPQHLVQMAAMDGKLWHLMPRPNTARFLPDFLAEAIQIAQFTRANANAIQRRQQIKRGQFADGVGQGIDAHTQRLHFRRRFQHGATNAAMMQHQRQR